MLGFFTLFAPLGSAGGAEPVPYLVFTASNALYPLMSLFLWLKLEDHIPYLSLYAAGKCIAVAAALAWFFVSAPKLLAYLPLDGAGALAALLFNVVIVFADTGSACSALLLKKRSSPAPAEDGTSEEGR
jgi:hypothetical protein